MTFEIALLLALIAVAVVGFSIDRVSADVVGLGLLLALVLTGLLPAAKAFAGFGSDTVIMIFALLVMTVALAKAGVVEVTGRLIVRLAGNHPHRLLLLVMTAVAGLSAFISNTAATALFIPIVIAVAGRAKIPTAR